MSTILIIHIVSASSLTIAMFGVLLISVVRKRMQKMVVTARIGFVATLTTGMLLIVTSPKSFTHLCMMMTCYSLATFALEALYRKRVQNVLRPSATTV